MGMPMYGQGFTLANPAEHGLNAPAAGPSHAGEFTRSNGFLAYYEVTCTPRVQSERVTYA